MSLPLLNSDDDFLILSAVGSPETANKIIALLNASGSDVSGPGSSTSNAIPRFTDASGQVLANSGVLIDNSNNVSGILSLTLTPGSAQIFANQLISANGTTLVLAGGISTAQNIFFRQGGVSIWEIENSNGNFVPSTDNATNIGSAPLRVHNLFLGGSITGPLQLASQTLQTPAAGALTLANGPGASTGNPSVYLTLNINGTNYVVPAWAF